MKTGTRFQKQRKSKTAKSSAGSDRAENIGAVNNRAIDDQMMRDLAVEARTANSIPLPPPM
jgi:hypothetical protein